MKIQVILGSTRQGRFGDKPAKWIVEKLKAMPEVEAELLDLRDWPLPFFDEPKSPASSGGEYILEAGKKWAEKIGEADGYIIVTPEYNHGYPAVLKNALDYVYKEWNNKPVGLVSYGTVGGARAVEQLREVVIELKMVPVRTAVHILAFWTLLDEKGNFKTETLEAKAEEMIGQVLWYAKVLKEARKG
jgi:NAD(P)H-dependent FMN reductase